MNDFSHDPYEPFEEPPKSPPPPPPPPTADNAKPPAPITSMVGAVEAILREPQRLTHHLGQPGAGVLTLRLLAVSLGCSLVYGLVVGTFSLHDQLWAAPVKIAGGLLLSALICLPSLYIFACLSGSQARLAEIFGLLGGLLLLTTVLLLGFAPVAWVFSQSTASVLWMGVLHLLFWGTAAVFGLRFLEAGFARTRPRSQSGFNTWVLIYLLVVLQMTAALRPLVGTANTFLPQTKKFFLNHWNDCLKAGE